VTVRLRSAGKPPAQVDLRVAGKQVQARSEGNSLVFEAGAILDHEVAVIDWN
jgi:hypothetical protein